MQNKTEFIFGGTFDPIHLGHLRALVEIHNEFPESSIRVLVNGKPPHRDLPVASVQHRKNMLKLAINPLDFCFLDFRETEREGLSYSYLTISELLKENPERHYAWVLGDDALASFHEWKNADALANKMNILVLGRKLSPDQSTSACSDKTYSKYFKCVSSPIEFLESEKGCVYRLNNPMLEISATQIRELYKNERSTRFLLPEAIIEYIRQHRLYMTP